ncbi:MAG TPA: glycosyl hydrolase [Polyangiales bacterium]|nr:glycosyl hydrolase [Polyangiales bacterium]
MKTQPTPDISPFPALALAVLLLLFAACSPESALEAREPSKAGAAGASTAGAAGTMPSVPTGAGRAASAPTAGSAGSAPTAGSGGRGAAGRSVVAGAGGAAGTRATAGAGSGASAGSAAGSGGASAPSDSAILVPARGALLGEYYGDGTVAQTETRIGRKPAVHLTYFAWNDDWTKVAASDLAAGKIPLVNWEPAGIDFKKIADGSLDSTIKARASGAAGLGKKFFLDFAAEMNGDEAWSGNDAKLYVDAYRHIHDLFEAAGATNVVWAWCPNVTDVTGGNKQTLDYYPGDDYVDWTGVDGYNWGAGSGFQWQSFHDVFARIYPVLATKGKPIVIGEMASDENGGDKAAWIDAMIPTLRSDFPMIKAVVWFDVKKERAWQINSSPESLAAYMRFANDPFMNP